MKPIIPMTTALLLLSACAANHKPIRVYPLSLKLAEQAKAPAASNPAPSIQQQAIAADIQKHFGLEPVQVKLLLVPQDADPMQSTILVSDEVLYEPMRLQTCRMPYWRNTWQPSACSDQASLN